ncbi:hypothetical protein CRUP_009400 [Coryphaenoides rupestris]|nr:hypothetical protein CRUP_009400 [Coryphaenoides rupestris]
MWNFICAAVTRLCFILVSLVGVFTVCGVKNDNNYWLLTLLFLPQIAEMIITLKWRGGKDYRWFSPAIFLFLISIIPSIWILELHHKQNSPMVNTKPGDEENPDLSLLTKYSKDLWTIVQALFIQDGPFLVVRLIVLIYFKGMESWKMLIFFAIKNSLVVLLNLYRLIIIYQDYRSSTN